MTQQIRGNQTGRLLETAKKLASSDAAPSAQTAATPKPEARAARRDAFVKGARPKSGNAAVVHARSTPKQLGAESAGARRSAGVASQLAIRSTQAK